MDEANAEEFEDPGSDPQHLFQVPTPPVTKVGKEGMESVASTMTVGKKESPGDRIRSSGMVVELNL